FPIVYKQGKQFYMTIHSVHSEDVRLYVSTEFPYKWKLDSILLKGLHRDPVIFEHNGICFLFTSSNEDSFLFYSNGFKGPYIAHNKSPFNEKKPMIARNAGNIFVWNNKIYRPVQDC